MAEKTDLIANRSMTYNTRRLLADEPFQAKPREARVLVAVGKARLPDGQTEIAGRSAPTPAPRKARAPRQAKS